MVEQLDEDARAAALDALGEWDYDEARDALVRRFVFADFVEAFGFMTRVAILAEKADHHPEWSNVYGKVVVDLVTHDAKGVTELDLELARRMSRIADR